MVWEYSYNPKLLFQVPLRPKTFYELTNGVLLKFADVQCQYFTELPADFDLKEEELEERPSCEPPLDIAVKEEEPEVQPNCVPPLDTLEEEETQERPDLVAPANLEEGEEREAGPDYEPTQAYALGEGDEDDETDDKTDVDDAMTARTSLTVKGTEGGFSRLAFLFSHLDLNDRTEWPILCHVERFQCVSNMNIFVFLS